MCKAQRQGGFTLIEVLIAITLLAVGILAAASMQITALGGNHLANRTTTATALASSIVEELMELDYDHEWLADTTDGTLDLNDPDAVEAALNNDDFDIATDEFINAHDPDEVQVPNFTIFWNVVDHYPYDNGLADEPVVKTIRVTVRRDDRGVQRDLSLDFIRSEYL